MTALPSDLLQRLDVLLAHSDARLVHDYPGPSTRRQPVHTAYAGAERATSDLPAQWGQAALSLLETHAPDPQQLAKATGLDPDLVVECWPRLMQRLQQFPIDDLRWDFEDGYRSSDASAGRDQHARRVGAVLNAFTYVKGAPYVSGIRVPSLDPGTRADAVRILDLVVSTAVAAGGLPDRFVVTAPKVRSVDQVTAMVLLCEALESTYGLSAESIGLELQVESPALIIGADGTVPLAQAMRAAGDRCVGLHYGTYDYSAAMGITSAHQSAAHAVADFAKSVMQVVCADTAVVVSDGSTQVIPEGDTATVHAAWALHAALVTRALGNGIYQGWDLHPGHLVTRHLATAVFFRAALATSSLRLLAYLNDNSTGVLDEPATARALAGAMLRTVDAGAADEDEITALTGLDLTTLRQVARTGQRPAAPPRAAGLSS